MTEFTGEAGAALVFLIGYLAVFAWMLFALPDAAYQMALKIFFCCSSTVTIRVASQACGIGFGVLGFRNTNLFLAFLILGAEGYFSLVLCTFRFVISWHQHNLASGQSWLEPRDDPNTNKLRKALVFVVLGPLAFLVYRDNPMVADPNSADTHTRLQVSKITRTAGQSVFLAGNALLLIIILVTIRNNRRDGDARKKKGTVHPTLILLLIAWFPLIVRGIFGILQAAVFSLSYYNPDNYRASGFTPRFTAIEYVLGVLTEWLACVLLNLTYLTSRDDPKKADLRDTAEKAEDSAPIDVA
ncbi:hypothetical protein DFH09DRAFT_1166976 [Mycena vulgaris]|nr:hypothetical protein DFH09DRAFT_1166976 [Mycena vulgaris]